MTNLPDVQISKPEIKIPIQEVGVENVKVPFILTKQKGGFISLLANVSIRTNLTENIKGISMSRLLETLKKYLDIPLNHNLIKEIMKEISEKVGSSCSFMRFEFDFPINRHSPLTENSFPIYHKCRFESRYNSLTKEFRFFQGVIFQYASYCPCSAELSKDLIKKNIMAFPHAQRSFANVIIETKKDSYIWLEDIISNLEFSIKTLPYPIIKRPDEQEIAKIAAENLIFVEDAIRLISWNLNLMVNIKDWYVSCVHEESIHTSEAIARNWKGIEDGFDYKYNL